MTKSTQKSGDASTLIGGTNAPATTNAQPVTRISDLSSQHQIAVGMPGAIRTCESLANGRWAA